jgi:DNA-directed RNA polymerase specialized sigma24 family protein
MATITSGILLEPHGARSSISRKELDELDKWFSRRQETLQYIACRVLADSELAARAIQNCWLKASSALGGFESESAFGSWVLRLLISEALAILHGTKHRR